MNGEASGVLARILAKKRDELPALGACPLRRAHVRFHCVARAAT
jgi:hypothetical protein